MESESLRQSLEGYEAQLQQISNTLKVTPQGDEYETLVSLQNDITLLIDMTKESLDRLRAGEASRANEQPADNPIDDEYALFMAEMADTGAFQKEDETKSTEENNKTEDIEEELSALQGMKCSVLYSHRWGGAASLHNAMVCSVERDTLHTKYDDIKVKVLFTNPTHVEMVPCPYYLDGDCRFTDEQCRYSHGEITSLSSLSEATEPNFDLLKPGCRALVKIIQTDEASGSRPQEKYLIWHRAVVQEVDRETLHCTIKLEHCATRSQEVHNIPYANILPLTDDMDDDTDTESSHSDLEEPSTSYVATKEQSIENSFTQNHGSVRLGDWEKYTKGIGSKLMLSMGWVSGSGLGANSEGRLHPVQCQLVPLGKSLDHCMEMKEGKDMGKMEKRLKKLQKKKEEREKRAYEREKDRERHNIFSVLNNVLSTNETSEIDNDVRKNKTTSADVKNKSCKGLNIEQFKLSEDETKINKEIEKLKSSLVRNNSDNNSAVFKSLTAQLNEKHRQLEAVRLKLSCVTKEQTSRKNSNKLTIF